MQIYMLDQRSVERIVEDWKKGHGVASDALYHTNEFINRHKLPLTTFFDQDSAFKQACSDAGITPTLRQAQKFRNRRGQAYNAYRASKVTS